MPKVLVVSTLVPGNRHDRRAHYTAPFALAAAAWQEARKPASSEMVYANADITKTEQAAEIIAFADYWNNATGSDPGLLVFDSQLTTYKILDELTGRGINWLTLRQRGKAELERLAALPASAWKTVTIARSGRYRRPRLHEDMVKLTGVSSRVRQIAIRGIGRDEPTLLITRDLATPAKDLFARYAERMMAENELDAYIGGFHLGALYLAQRLARTAARDGVYTAQAARLLLILGWWLLAGGLVATVTEAFARMNLLGQLVTWNVDWGPWPVAWSVSWPVVWIGLGLITFARVMRIGAGMRADLEGTV